MFNSYKTVGRLKIRRLSSTMSLNRKEVESGPTPPFWIMRVEEARQAQLSKYTVLKIAGKSCQ